MVENGKGGNLETEREERGSGVMNYDEYEALQVDTLV